MNRKFLITIVLALAFGLLAVRAMDLLPQPNRQWLDYAFAPIGLLILAVSLKRVKTQNPNFRYCPGKIRSRRYLISGLILLPLSFLWVIGAIVIATTRFPKSEIATQLVLWPFLLMLIAGTTLIAIPIVNWLYRKIGIKAWDED